MSLILKLHKKYDFFVSVKRDERSEALIAEFPAQSIFKKTQNPKSKIIYNPVATGFDVFVQDVEGKMKDSTEYTLPPYAKNVFVLSHIQATCIRRNIHPDLIDFAKDVHYKVEEEQKEKSLLALFARFYETPHAELAEEAAQNGVADGFKVIQEILTF